MASHKQELANAAERFDLDRQRQMLAMREKLAQNRKRKMDALRKKQESELTKEAMLQQKELDEIRGKKVKHFFNFFTYVTVHVKVCGSYQFLRYT